MWGEMGYIYFYTHIEMCRDTEGHMKVASDVEGQPGIHEQMERT